MHGLHRTLSKRFRSAGARVCLCMWGGGVCVQSEKTYKTILGVDPKYYGAHVGLGTTYALMRKVGTGLLGAVPLLLTLTPPLPPQHLYSTSNVFTTWNAVSTCSQHGMPSVSSSVPH